MKRKLFRIESVIISLIIMLFSMILFVGCKKNFTNTIHELSSEQIINEIKNDSNFYNYIATLNLLVNKTLPNFSKVSINENINSKDIIDEEKFIALFKESIENNNESKRKISNYMGFQNSIDFWNIRALLNSSLSNLLKKYDFKKVSKLQWYELVNASKDYNSKQLQIKFKVFMLNPDTCIEQFKDCSDDANAQYAVETLACVGWGALGWTVVGGVLFVGCEGLSYYHLQTMNRKCVSSYKACK